MASSKKNDVISVAPPHSIKKFELIAELRLGLTFLC